MYADSSPFDFGDVFELHQLQKTPGVFPPAYVVVTGITPAGELTLRNWEVDRAHAGEDLSVPYERANALRNDGIWVFVRNSAEAVNESLKAQCDALWNLLQTQQTALRDKRTV